MVSKKLSSAIGVIIILITIAFLLSSDNEVANASAGSKNLIPTATFPGTNTGAIPDHTGTCQTAPFNTGRDVAFNVTGITGAPTGIEVSTTFGGPNHSWMGDVTATLIAPGGSPSFVIFGRTLATTAGGSGDNTDLGGPYVFKDSAAAPPNGGWWQTANILGAAVPMTTGDYRTTASGGAGATIPMPPTNLNAAFAGVANANGTWTLKLQDGCALDTGAISAASLTMSGSIVVPADANVDMNGDGRTDYVVARGTNTPLALTGSNLRPGQIGYSLLDERPARTSRQPAAEAVPEAPLIYWYTLLNNSATTSVQPFGDAATDFIVPEDYDGDGKDDIAIWRAVGGGGQFWIFQSSTNTAVGHTFGQDGDDPAVVGDYDGDNKADVTVFRCPPEGGADGQCFFFYRGTLNNPGGNITYVPWGFGVDADFFPYVGDFDGDGKNDFCLQRAHPSNAANGQFVLLKSSNLGTEFIDWGFSSDFLIPGDYDGDGKTDICVRRSNTPSPGVRTYFVLYRAGGSNTVVWGQAGDASTPGDYDGDNKTDFVIWRGSTTPGTSGFWVLRSSDLGASFTQWGQCPNPGIGDCDFAVAGWAVH